MAQKIQPEPDTGVVGALCRGLGNGVRRNGVRKRVCIDDAGSILKFRIGFPFGENSAGVLQVRVASGVDTEFPYRVRNVDRRLIAVTLFAATVSDSQTLRTIHQG